MSKTNDAQVSQPRPFTFDRVVRILITLAVLAAVVWLVDVLRDVLLPFLVACLIAYLLEPFVQFNRTLLHLKGRIVAIFITLSESLLLVGAICYFFVPSIIDECHQMAVMFQKYAMSDVTVQHLPDAVHDFLKRNIDFEAMGEKLLKQDMQSLIDKGLTVIQGGLSVILGIIGWLIVVLYVIFIMLDYDRLTSGFRRAVPPRLRPLVFKIGGDVKRSMNLYFRGQATIALIVAVIYSCGFLIIGLPLAVVIGVCTGLLFMIPYCQFISIIPVTLLCLVDSADTGCAFWPMWWECMAVFALVQVVADLILTPRIMGKAMGLNPAIILLSLSVWGTLFGFIGFIIALPMTTLLLSYYEEYVIRPKK